MKEAPPSTFFPSTGEDGREKRGMDRETDLCRARAKESRVEQVCSVKVGRLGQGRNLARLGANVLKYM